MYRIAEVAEMTGVPATTIRFYEGQGLLRPAERRANGYRTYRERDVARLRFVNRARALDLPVDDLRELVELWEDDECVGVAGRMREQVHHRLGAVQERIAALTTLAFELQQVQQRLQVEAHAGPCDAEYACVDRPAGPAGLPMVASTDGGDDPIACRLDPAAMPARVSEWHRVLAQATGRTAVPDGVAVHFPMDRDLVADLVEVARAEQQCCSFFGFSLEIAGDGVRLVVTAPPEAAPMVATLFGVPD